MWRGELVGIYLAPAKGERLSPARAAALRDYAVEVAPDETRRNLLTRGVPLNHLMGRVFRVGEVLLRGVKLCEPCDHLESLTRTGVRKALVHRGGLRTEVVRGGTIHIGDAIEEEQGR